MVKKAHHSTKYRSREIVTGAVSALSLLAVTTQAVNAEQLTVKTGDTIWGLAKQHGLSVSALEQANPSVKKLSDSVDLITVGQQLTLPSTAHQDVKMSLNADGSYTVKPGDTLSSIANYYNISVSQLMNWNNLSSADSLYIGQQLSVTGPATNISGTTGQQDVPQSAMTSAVTVNSPIQPAVTNQQSVTPAVSQTPVTSSVSVASQVVSAEVNANSETTRTTTQQGTVASSVAEVSASPTSTAATVTSNVTANSSSVESQSTATLQVNTAAPASNATATSGQVKADKNYAALYTQSFVQAAPVASQTPQSQATPVSQASVSSSQNIGQQSVATTQVQQQSQTPASQSAQATSNASQDLQHGSVVSLATKIANSNSVPYVWGGDSLGGMDCSGLVKYVYANAEGKQLPHYTGALENCVDQHPVSQAKPGDLLFWGSHGSTYHTAIYTGNNQYVAAAKPGTNVATYTISPYFNPSFAGTVK